MNFNRLLKAGKGLSMDNDDLIQRFLKAFKALPEHEQIAVTLRIERAVHEEALSPNSTLPISEKNNG